MHDSTLKLQHSFGDILKAPLSIHVLIYADDTLLIDNSVASVQKYMEVIISTGMEYGLKINWDKVDVFGIRCQPKVQNSSGADFQRKQSIQYLGALIMWQLIALIMWHHRFYHVRTSKPKNRGQVQLHSNYSNDGKQHESKVIPVRKNYYRSISKSR